MAKTKKSNALFPKELTTVTPLSKAMAFIAFLTIPIIAFFFGIRYQEMVNPVQEYVPNYVSSTTLLEKTSPITPPATKEMRAY